jgi:ribose/xylose/arabinose/galactoside ABC-type transport system permease subunit
MPRGIDYKDWFRKYGIIAVFALLCVAAAILTRGTFLQPDNLRNVLRQVSMESIIAIGMTLVIISGGIDLSVGSSVALTGVVTCLTMTHCPGPFLFVLPVSILFGILVGAACGAVNGFFVTKFNIPPFITSLAVMTAARGLSYIICGGQPVWNLPKGFSWIGRGFVFGFVPVPVVIMFALMFAGHVFLSQTRHGRYIYAVGGNSEAARLSGINVNRFLFLVYVITGVLAAIAGIILASRLGAGDPKSGMMWELNVIAAVVVGGTSLSGGEGSILGTFFGALIIGVVNNTLNLMNVDAYWQQVVLGSVILLAVLLDKLKNRGV